MAQLPEDTAPATDRLHSVRRSLAMLEALAARPAGASPKELSQALGMHLSTSYRLLNTFVAGGYAVRSPEDGLFRLGARVAYLHQGYLASVRPLPAALPFVHALQLATGETTMLAQAEGDDVVATGVAAGSRPGAYPPVHVGLAITAHAVAAGKVLLAELPAVQLDAYIARQMARSEAPFPLRRPDTLRADLARIRRDGYALDRGDGHPDVCCIATPVRDLAGAVNASITILAPCNRFRQEEATLIAVIRAVTGAIGSLQESVSSNGHGDAIRIESGAAPPAPIEAALAAINAAMSRVG
jgi:DNA-binding IclR family transcriptional regulator